MNTDKEAQATLNPGIPLAQLKLDRLGYAPFARRLAHALLKMTPQEGLVIALYGSWGSGKTTVLNFVQKSLEELQEDQKLPSEPAKALSKSGKQPTKVVIVPFNPWWFSGREDLVRAFFLTVSAALEAAKYPTPISEAFKKLGQVAARLPIPTGLGPTTQDVAKWGEVVQQLLGDPQELAKQKESVGELLRKQDQRLVITIDDIDRLSSDEIIDLFRVVKSIADLPRITYLLSFDKTAVAEILKGKLGVSGEDYLEKIVQVPFEMPVPDTDSFSAFFIDELNKVIAELPDDIDAEYLRAMYAGIRHFLRTPRRLLRLLNIFNVLLAGLRGDVDPVDLLAIETLRLYCPDLHRKIVQFPHLFTEFPGGGFGKQDKQQIEVWLDQLPDESQTGAAIILSEMFNRPPRSGFIPSYQQSNDPRRIRNYESFPIYFHFSIPGWGVSREECDAILDLLDKPEDFHGLLNKLKDQVRPAGGTRLNSFLDAALLPAQKLNTDRSRAMIVALFDFGDQYLAGDDYGRNPLGIPFGNEMGILRLVLQCLRNLPEKERANYLSEAIPASRSIVPLVHTVFSLGTDFGRHGGKREPLNQLVTESELDKLEQLALEKIIARSKDRTLVQASELKQVLLAWKDWQGHDADISNWIKDLSTESETLLQFLDNFFVTTSIQADSLEYFVSLDHIMPQMEKLDYQALTPRQREIVAMCRMSHQKKPP